MDEKSQLTVELQKLREELKNEKLRLLNEMSEKLSD